ncbi:hypothetical protein Tco_0743173 [Tanacetum coccineum]
MLVTKRFKERKKIFRERKLSENFRAKRRVFLQGMEQYLEARKSNGHWGRYSIRREAMIGVWRCEVEMVVMEGEHPRCCQENGSKVEEKLVHLKMVVKFKVLIEKKKMCSLGLMRFDLWMEFLMVHLEELEMKKLLCEKV